MMIEFLYSGIQANITVGSTNPVRQSINQHFQSFVERKKQTVTSTTDSGLILYPASSSPHRDDQTSIALFHIQKTRQRCAQAQYLGVSGVDSSDHRLRHPFQSFVPETTTNKTREGFIVIPIFRSARQKKIGSHSQLSAQRKDVARHKRPHA